MDDVQQRKAAKEFAEYWKDRGYEKGESQPFWLSLLQDVYGVKHPEQYISFEDQVHLDHASFIDGYIEKTHVMIEQKSINKSLTAAIRQSDGSMLTPFEQAKRYSSELPYSKRPRWIVTSNFQYFYIYDMEKPNGEPAIIELANLEKEYYRLEFLTKRENINIKKEMEVSKAAGDIVGLLYDALRKQYSHPENIDTMKSLNVLCVRLVFCLYAEDAGIFGSRGLFHDYLEEFDVRGTRKALIELFKTLDTKEEERDPYLENDNQLLAAFPYVNGGLFSNENIEIPPFTDEIRKLLLEDASANFDWAEISPTIFGAIFESTLNPETRHNGGMHYTSIENIHKVIDPLFLDDLKGELEEIKRINRFKIDNTINPYAVSRKIQALDDLQGKLTKIRILDPACGSGNFLTESYLSIRKIENEIIRERLAATKESVKGQMVMAFDAAEKEERNNPVKVSISQFYGIEVNDFAVTVAKTALWIAESQMLKITEEILYQKIDFLPLKTNAYIKEADALQYNWKELVRPSDLSYIIGNPPFLGGMNMSDIQKSEIRRLFNGVTGAGEFDYVTGWYKKATEYIIGTKVRCAFVSTNSICQGSQVITFWKHLFTNYNIHIDFAYTTFIWNNEATNQAKVHCVIVGFSGINATVKEKRLYSNGAVYKICDQISPYLTDTPITFIEARSNPICNVPPMRFGSMPRDGGGFVLTPEEREELIRKEPLAEKWIRPYIGATEFLNNKKRYCLWLVGADPGEIKKCPTVRKRVEFVRQTRASSKAAGTRKFAETPTLFCQIAQPDTDYIIVPKTSSGKREYIPLGFMRSRTIASDLVFLIPGAGLYEFGILMSSMHNSWMRLVAGRLKSDYRYAKDIVYNNFPWPELTTSRKMRIEQTAGGILKARALYPKSTLANMYDSALMPPELRKAHSLNDKFVKEAYGISNNASEVECVAELMKRYQKITN